MKGLLLIVSPFIVYIHFPKELVWINHKDLKNLYPQNLGV